MYPLHAPRWGPAAPNMAGAFLHLPASAKQAVSAVIKWLCLTMCLCLSGNRPEGFTMTVLAGGLHISTMEVCSTLNVDSTTTGMSSWHGELPWAQLSSPVR